MNGTTRTGLENLALPGDVQIWRRQLVRNILRALVVVGGMALVGASYDAWVSQQLFQIPILAGLYLSLLIITFGSKIPYTVQAGALLVVFYFLGGFTLYLNGKDGVAFSFLLTLPFFAVLFFSWRVAVGILVLALATVIGFGGAIVAGVLVVPVSDPQAVSEWISRGTVFLMLSSLLMLAQTYLFRRLTAALSVSQDLTRALQDERRKLETQVTERTADLTRRTRYLEAITQVAQDVVTILDLQELLSRVTDLISERLGFYHTAIFLLDSTGAWAELRAASGVGGQRLLTRGYRLPVGEGLVGTVAAQGVYRLAAEVGASEQFQRRELADSRSEIALPLRARGEIIGVLDVHSRESDAFGEEAITALQSLADQVAVAISNARLFAQLQESVTAERRAYGELSRTAWQELLRAESEPGFLSRETGITPAGDLWRPEMAEALAKGAVVANGPTVAVPIKVRDQVIGVVDGCKPGGTGEWTPDEIALLQLMTDQLGVALESARLYQDTQRRAAQEQAVGAVAAQLRASTDTDAILRTVAQELGQLLGASTLVHLLPAAAQVTDEGGEGAPA